MDKNEIAIEKMLHGKDEEILTMFFTVRQIILDLSKDIEETIKWNMPCYEFKGNICGVGAFKKHISIWFHKAELMSDHFQLFEKNSSMGQIKLYAMKDLEQEKLTYYFNEAMLLNENGIQIPKKPKNKTSKSKVAIPEILKEALNEHLSASDFFNTLTVAQQNGFIIYVEEAKQESTKVKRVAKCIERLENGFKSFY